MIYQLVNRNNIVGALARIEQKSDYITMLMNVCDYILLNNPLITVYRHYSPKLNDIIITSNRLYIFYSNAKYVSAVFPFNYSLTKNQFYYGPVDINRLTISHIRNIMDKIDEPEGLKKIEDKCNSGVSPSDDEYVTDSDFDLAKKLLDIEPGYIRFDHDPKNENGRIHPLFHLDINYDSGATYKIGLEDQISPSRFFELLNNNLEREYLYNSSLYDKDRGRVIHNVLDSLKVYVK